MQRKSIRKGVADLHRRCEVGEKSNAHYWEGMPAVEHDQPLGKTVVPYCQPTEFQGRRVRALQPLGKEDVELLAAVIRGEFALHGFRNRDLREALFGSQKVAPEAAKRQGATVTRLLRAHGVPTGLSKGLTRSTVTWYSPISGTVTVRADSTVFLEKCSRE